MGLQRMYRRLAELPEEQLTARDRRAVVRRLLAYTRPYRGAMLLLLLAIAAFSFYQGAAPTLIGRAVDQALLPRDPIALRRFALLLLGVYALGLVAQSAQMHLVASLGYRILATMRQQLMDQVLRLSLRYLEREEAGDLMSRLVNDLDIVQTFFSQTLRQVLGSLFALVGIVLAMFLLDWRLALVAFSVIPLMWLATQWVAALARRAFRRARETIGDVSADLQEELEGIRVAQAFSRTQENIRRFVERNRRNMEANITAGAITSAFGPAVDVLSTLGLALVAGVGGYMAVAGLVTVGVVVAFVQYVQAFFRPVRMLAAQWTMAQSALAASERLFEVLDLPPDLTSPPNAVRLPPLRGEVTFDHVSFAYDDEQWVLRDIHLHVEPGQTVAIVGPTGAGKTTLVSLIPRFYDPQRGRVLIDGHDLRTVDLTSLRRQMGLVLQEPFLFNTTVLENIRFGRPEASREEVVAAAKAAQAHDFITRLPQGYDTVVGERGKLLSLGQRQLIAIARALLVDPRIIILDEATASVDTRTEVRIQAALRHLLQGRTAFVIAHRLSTVREADCIIVLDQGRVVEQGTHADLLAAGGLYAALYQRQFAHMEGWLEGGAA